MKKTILTVTAIATIIGIATANAQAPEKSASAPKMEKCYGVAKAGQNDCHGPGHSCAGSAKKDGDKAEHINLPAGLCNKLVGGSLKAS